MLLCGVLAEHRASLGELPGWLPFNLFDEVMCSPQTVNSSLAWLSIMWDTHTHYGFRGDGEADGDDDGFSGGGDLFVPVTIEREETYTVTSANGRLSSTTAYTFGSAAWAAMSHAYGGASITGVGVSVKANIFDTVAPYAYPAECDLVDLQAVHHSGNYGIHAKVVLDTSYIDTAMVKRYRIVIDGADVGHLMLSNDSWSHVRLVINLIEGGMWGRLEVGSTAVWQGWLSSDPSWAAKSSYMRSYQRVSPDPFLLTHIFVSTPIVRSAAVGWTESTGGGWSETKFQPAQSAVGFYEGASHDAFTFTDSFAIESSGGDILYIPGSENSEEGSSITEETLGALPPFAPTSVSNLDKATMDGLIRWVDYVSSLLYAHLTS